MRYTTTSHPRDPALDMALSHAQLRDVASGREPELARIFRPGPTMAFGRLDALAPGYPAARAAALAHGYAPALRLGGGHVAGYDQDAVVVELITRTASVAAGIQERFAAGMALVSAALSGLGVEALLGALPGEYCPGRWSLHLAGGPKVAGAAQRTIRGASLFTAVVIVGGGARLRGALSAVYDALGLAWTPATAGAVDDVHPAVTAAAVQAAVVDELRRSHGAVAAPLSEATRTAALALAAQHR